MSRARFLVALALLAGTAFGAVRLRGVRAPGVSGANLRELPVQLGDWAGRDQEITERQYRLLETREVLLRAS